MVQRRYPQRPCPQCRQEVGIQDILKLSHYPLCWVDNKNCSCIWFLHSEFITHKQAKQKNHRCISDIDIGLLNSLTTIWGWEGTKNSRPVGSLRWELYEKYRQPPTQLNNKHHHNDVPFALTWRGFNGSFQSVAENLFHKGQLRRALWTGSV